MAANFLFHQDILKLYSLQVSTDAQGQPTYKLVETSELLRNLLMDHAKRIKTLEDKIKALEAV